MKKILTIIGLCGASLSCFAQSFTSNSATGAWNTSRWNNTSDGPTYTETYTSGNAVNFASGNYTFAGMGTSTNVGNLTVSSGANVTFASIGSTFGTGGNVRLINVAEGSTLDFSTQSFSTASGTGFIKSGAGVLALAGGGYNGGFTLNSGTVILRGVNAMGDGGLLTLNGGIVAGSTTRDLTDKYDSGIVIGGNVQFGELASNVSIASSTASLTFSNSMNLGAATRTFTHGNNGTVTFGGAITNSSGGIIFAANSGTSGRFDLGGANSYAGNTTISSGTVRLITGDNRLPTGTVVNMGQSGSAVLGRLELQGLNQEIAGLVSVMGTNSNGTLSNVVTSNTSANLTINTAGNSTYTYGSNTTQNSGILTGALNLIKTGNGTQILGGINTYNGTTSIQAGTLIVNGSISSSSGVSISANASLAGSGTVGALAGAGRINPGNSPGILTATTINLSGGMDFSFELNSIGTPTWSNATASSNDVLRLTDGTDAFAGTSASAINTFDIYFGVSSLAEGNTFTGGIFSTLTLAGKISGGTYNYFVLGDGNGTNIYNGVGYYTLAEYNAVNTTSWNIAQGFVSVPSADFSTGTISGFSQSFEVIPEPSTWLLISLGSAFLVWNTRRRFQTQS